MNFTVETIAALLVSLGIGGALVAFINGVFNRGKIGAEKVALEAQADEYLARATETIVKSFETANRSLQDQLSSARAELEAAKQDLIVTNKLLTSARVDLVYTNRRLNKALGMLAKQGEDVSKLLERSDAEHNGEED